MAMALQIVDSEGLSALSMRRLGAALGVEAMALYRYADSKDALLDGVVEAFYLELEQTVASRPDPVPVAPGMPEWRSALHDIAQVTYEIALRHPHVVPLLATRLLSVPLARRPHPVLRIDERILRSLDEARLDDHTIAAAHRAFTAWLLGYLFADLRAMVDAPEETEPAFRYGLHRLPAQDFPQLRARTASLAERGGAPELAAGVEALLDRVTRAHGRAGGDQPA